MGRSCAVADDRVWEVAALEVEQRRIADMLVDRWKGSCPREGPMEESYLQRRAKDRKVCWIDTMEMEREVESPSPSLFCPCWSWCVSYAAKAEKLSVPYN